MMPCCQLEEHIQQESTIELLNSRIAQFKERNTELVKTLAESQKNYYQVIEERDSLQGQLFTLNLQYMKLYNMLKEFNTSSQACINMVVSLSSHLTDMLEISNIISSLRLDPKACLPESTGSVNSSPTSILKTQAVKPMIDGHVIFRPTINLRRVNARQLAEIQRQQNINNLNNSFNEREENVLRSEQLQQLPNEDNARSHNHFQQSDFNELSGPIGQEGEEHAIDGDASSESFEDIQDSNRGLDVISEEGELVSTGISSSNTHNGSTITPHSISIPSRNSEMALFSGVFKDVRVYLSPMDTHKYITNERGSSKRKFKTTKSIHPAVSSSNNISRDIPDTPFINLSKTPKSDENLNITSNSTNNLMNVSGTSNSNSAVLHSPRPSTSKRPTDSFGHLSNNSNLGNTFKWENLSISLSDLKQKQNSILKTDNKENVTSNNNELSSMTHSASNWEMAPSSDQLFSDDPLEGPSTLLDSLDNKSEFLSKLSLKSSGERASDKIVANCKQSSYSLRNGSKRINKKPTKDPSYVSIKQRKKPNFSTSSPKIAKIVLQRLSASPVMSPIKKSVNVNKRGGNSSSNIKEEKNTTKTRKTVTKKVKISPKVASKKVLPTKLPSTSENVNDTALCKNERPKRNIKKICLKEPSIVKKLRRSH